MNCPFCNSDLASGLKFCPKCGNSIADKTMESPPKSSGGGLIAALLIFLFVAGAGVIGYLYFFAEPKRHETEDKTITDSAPSKPVGKDQEVPMPDAGPSQSSQPEQKQEISQPAIEPSEPQKQETTTESSQPQKEAAEPTPKDAPIAEPPADVVKPVLIHRVNPEYPEVARRARVQGVVILEATVTREGTVENLKVIRGLHPILDQAATKAVQQWRYKPATLNGKPVKVYYTISVKFTLKN